MTDIRRITRTMTADSLALAISLALVDPSWGTRTVPVADGWAVLCGAGFFVNRLEGAGFDAPVTSAQLDEFEELAWSVGVTPAIALVDFTEDSHRNLLNGRGYRAESAVSVAVAQLDELSICDEIVSAFTLEPADDEDSLHAWEVHAALGWRHDTPARRRASDAFTRAAARAEGSSLMLVRESATERIVATCALTVRDGVATLGGMSVLPTERRRGVQEAAIRLRFALAKQAGCHLAVTSTVVGGASERNVRRHDFHHSHVVTTWTKMSV